MRRRTFLKTSSAALVASTGGLPIRGAHVRETGIKPTLSLNAYSFNQALLSGEMSLNDLFRFAASAGFPAVDLTAYYIPGYPEVPDDSILYEIKRMAFRLGVAISGTGVRNDFTIEDPALLEENINLVKGWIVAASKLGAPHVRVFAGRGTETGQPKEKVMAQVIASFRRCAAFAGEHGVMLAFQNHDDFIKSTETIVQVMESVDPQWFGLMLDIGSITGSDPYSDIERLIPYSISWQVKEEVRSEEGRVPTDFGKLMPVVRRSGYTGYFPLETLGEGDPKQKVTALFAKVISYL